VGRTHFIMAARDRTTGKASTVPSLKFEDNDCEGKNTFEEGRQRSVFRKARAEVSLSRTPPKPDEVELMHRLYLESREVKMQRRAIVEAFLNEDSFPVINSENLGHNTESLVRRQELQQYRRDFKWMRETAFRNTFHMHSQDRNIHGNIFGGYLMKEAFELASICASLFYGCANNSPSFKFVDEIRFAEPVPVGSLLQFAATVMYTHDRLCVVQVEAFKFQPSNNMRYRTKKLKYIFEAPEEVVKPKQVMPSEYDEFVLYLEGRRSIEAYLGHKIE
jgi:acyl-coenzyme A thioesterase 9